MTPIYISTSQAAALAGINPHVIYSQVRRNGHWKNIIPVPGRRGRLSWPAAEVRAACQCLPPMPMPAGSDAFLRWALPLTPEIKPEALALLAAKVFGHGEHEDDALTLEGRWITAAVLAWVERLHRAPHRTFRTVDTALWCGRSVTAALASFQGLGSPRHV